MCSLYKTNLLFLRGQYFLKSFFAQRYMTRLLSMIVRYTERERERDAVNSWFSHGQQQLQRVPFRRPLTGGIHRLPACQGSVGGQVRAQRTTNTHLTAAMLWRHTSWLVGGLLSPPLWNTAATADEYRWCPSIHTHVPVTRKHRLRRKQCS